MKNLYSSLLILLGLFALSAFMIPANQIRPTSQKETVEAPLKGTWKMVRNKWGKMKKHKPAARREIYKIFTKSHFFFSSSPIKSMAPSSVFKNM